MKRLLLIPIAAIIFSNIGGQTKRPQATRTITVTPTLKPMINLPVEASSPTDIKSPGIPVRIMIPAIGLDSPILSETLDEVKAVNVPPDDIGWYERGVRPGEIGSAVLQGHFTSLSGGQGIFYHLSQLKTGDVIRIIDNQKQQFDFKVTATELVSYEDFPLQKVYGASPGSALNLVTCAGQYVGGERDYTHRTIVYAELL